MTNYVSTAESRATCSNCDEDVCRDNILEDIIREDVLTSGFFGVTLTATKPKGEKIYIVLSSRHYTCVNVN